VIGGRELDSFLTGKDDVAQELEQQVRELATSLGLEVRSVGIKDVILPGDMKDLMKPRATITTQTGVAELTFVGYPTRIPVIALVRFHLPVQAIEIDVRRE
jgi:hypothetical protein